MIYEYDQSLMAGPPFSVDADEMHALYGSCYEVKRLPHAHRIENFKDDVDAEECIWLLRA